MFDYFIKKLFLKVYTNGILLLSMLYELVIKVIIIILIIDNNTDTDLKKMFPDIDIDYL